VTRNFATIVPLTASAPPPYVNVTTPAPCAGARERLDREGAPVRERQRVLEHVAGLGYVAANIRELGDVLLTFRDRIAHPNPERAVLLGLLSVATVIEVRSLEQPSMWAEVLPISDEEMQAELTRSFIAYLQCS
jgi:hypothetical protein